MLAVGGLLAALGAVALAVRRREWALPALIAVGLAGAVPALVIGAPWVDAKVLAICSPIALLGAATLVAAGLESRGTREPAAAAAAVLCAASAWSTLDVVRDVYVAPRGRLAELRTLGRLLAGHGPTLVLDFEIYAQRHFLRDAVPEGATDLRVHTIPRLDGSTFPDFTSTEVDDVQPAALEAFRVLVRRRTPVGSRPPGDFLRVFAGPGFEAWARNPTAPAALVHQALGDPLAPVAVPRCATIRGVARTPGVRTVAAVRRRAPIVVGLAAGGLPPPWRTAAGVRPVVDGSAAIGVDVPVAGRWRVWVGGSVLGRLTVTVDDHAVGTVRHELAHDGQWMRFATVALAAGHHTVVLGYHRGGLLRAGRGAAGDQLPLGPLALSPAADDAAQPVEHVPAAAYRRLCDGAGYDWLEGLP